MSGHAEELEGLFDAREEEEIEFEDEGVEASPTSTNSDGFTDVKDSDSEEEDEPPKVKGAPKGKDKTAGDISKKANPSSGAIKPKAKGAGSIAVGASAGPYVPPTPIMGGITKTGADSYVPWVGGVPKFNWSGLKDPNPTNVEPKQQRPTTINSASKSQHYRTTEMEVKFG